MKKFTGLVAGCLVVGGLLAGVEAVAQEMTPPSPPKVLVISREYLKPGRAGGVHERSESAFVQAMTAAKWPVHYFAVESMSGPSRALFLTGYPSFAAWEKDNQNTAKNTALTAALEHAALMDGDLLTAYDQNVFVYRDDISLRSNVDIAHMRYFQILLFQVRPGHDKEWEELAKMYKDGYEKAVPDAKWAVFESAFGANNGGLVAIFIPMKTLAEVDEGFANDKKFMDAVGANGMKKLAELSASSVESEQVNLFQFNPKMSYPQEEWIKADPDFWKPKMDAPAEVKPAE